MPTKKKVVVIGAGPGGLAAAMLLSDKGYQVDVFEKQPFIGGRTSELKVGDFRFDRGATFLMMPHLFEELFASVGRNLHDYVTLKEVDPLYTLRFGNIDFSPSRNRKNTEAQIVRLFPGNVEGYRKFMKKEGKKFESVAKLLQMPFTRKSDLFRKEVWQALPKLNAIETVYGRLSDYFSDERLKWAFSFQAKYLGMSPWQCPGTFTILSWMEHEYGLFHPIGGVNKICDAMANIVKENGGQINTNSGVSRVLTYNRKAIGVELENGEQIMADDVVINADFAHAATRFFADGLLRKYKRQKLEKRSYSCSTFMLYLGIDKPVPLPHHTIFFADDYEKNVKELTERFVLSHDPSIYVHNPSAMDSTMAPVGQSALYILMPVPNLDAAVDWEKDEETVRNLVLERLEKEPELRDIRSHIVAEQRITPLDWQNDHYVYKGATFNLSHKLSQMMYFRPHNRFEEVDHCFLVGGGTHPGSGLPTIIESAKISAELLDQQYPVGLPAVHEGTLTLKGRSMG